MPHHRVRLAQAVVEKTLSFSPSVGVLGMRQVGKSTLIKGLSASYKSFDDEGAIIQFIQSPQRFLSAKQWPMAIDEIQKLPQAFDAIKYAIDLNNRPGHYLVSGSVRFSSRQGVRESLTGRIILVNMFPLTLGESHQKPASSFLTTLLHKKSAAWVATLKKYAWVNEKQIRHYRQCGGLPGICFKHDSSARHELFENHIDTLLARDIHMIQRVSLGLPKLRLLLKELAEWQGTHCSMSHLARVVGCSVPTIKTLLQAFEALFLIRSYGQSFYLEDSGLSHHLAPVQTQISHLDMKRLLFTELRAQQEYQLRHQTTMEPYLTRAGIDIPFVISTKTGERLAIIVEDTAMPSHKSLKSMTWYLKKFPKAKTVALLDCHEPFVATTGLICLPWTWVF